MAEKKEARQLKPWYVKSVGGMSDAVNERVKELIKARLSEAEKIKD